MKCATCSDEVTEMPIFEFICLVDGQWRFACTHRPVLNPDVCLFSMACALSYADEHPEHRLPITNLVTTWIQRRHCHHEPSLPQ